ncbi:hypothetical protein AAMO2058_000911300 [Amorphochlora amoebiformis]
MAEFGVGEMSQSFKDDNVGTMVSTSYEKGTMEIARGPLKSTLESVDGGTLHDDGSLMDPMHDSAHLLPREAKKGGDFQANESLINMSIAGDLKGVKQALDEGADCDGRGGEIKATALVHAAMKGHQDIVQLLVHYGRLDVDETDVDGRTAVAWASGNNHLEILEILVESKASINAPDSSGDTPLILAARNNHIDIVKYLVEKTDADLKAKGFLKKTALEQASSRKLHDVVEYLHEQEVQIFCSANNIFTFICVYPKYIFDTK